ncbi:MAG: hypothetical protein A2096_02260 [Spirochaetes bacterium GWF1_41_5]|nr:MAG: hypothetical protein A2096_02260 [Spirochaetes bacterium GWF1_41_5]HBE04387.1 hypothetical protein [Spirochaetia bacterium]
MLKYSYLRFCLNCAELRAWFPEAVFRGALGYTLIKKYCLQKNHEKNCRICPFNKHCINALFFHPEPAAESIIKTSTPPMPFSLFARNVSGQWFLFFILIGPAMEYSAELIDAICEMGREGVSRTKIKFSVLNIMDMHTGIELFNQNTSIIKKPACGEFNLSLLKGNSAADLQIITLSPWRIQIQSKLTRSWQFEDLVKKLLLRYSLLLSTYSGMNYEYSEFLEMAGQVILVNNNLRLVSRRRFSSTQQSIIDMDGMIGKMTFHGPVRDFEKLLEFGALFGIGKNTAFGCGRFEYRFSDK